MSHQTQFTTAVSKEEKRLQTAHTLAVARLGMLKYEEEDVKCKIVRQTQAIQDLERDLECCLRKTI